MLVELLLWPAAMGGLFVGWLGVALMHLRFCLVFRFGDTLLFCVGWIALDMRMLDWFTYFMMLMVFVEWWFGRKNSVARGKFGLLFMRWFARRVLVGFATFLVNFMDGLHRN
eukprot:gene3159-2141_t